MFFTNFNSHTQQSQPQYQDNPYKRMNRMVNFPVLSPELPVRQLIQSSALTQAPSQPPQQHRILWGEPTWFLFHTMAHKIKDDLFLQKRAELLNVIYIICCNLPCPDCANHAKEYLDRIQYMSIYSKQQLKDVLFHFHNEVNQRKGVPLFLYTQLDEKYKTAIMRNMIINFMTHFDRKGKLLPDTMQRNTHIVYLKKWFNANIQIFDN
jgi:hypothetical protein